MINLVTKNIWMKFAAILVCVFMFTFMVEYRALFLGSIGSVEIFASDFEIPKYLIGIKITQNSYLYTILACIIILYFMFICCFELEEKWNRKHFVFALINLVVNIFYVCSISLIQIYIALVLSTILTCLLIENKTSQKKFIINNIVADFIFLAASVLIYNQTNSMIIETIDMYDVSSITLALILISAVIKSSMIFFHDWMINDDENSFARLGIITLCATPVVGIMIIAKFYNLFVDHQIMMAIIATIGTITAIYAFYICLLQDNIKRIYLYLSLAFLGFNMLVIGLYGIEYINRTLIISIVARMMMVMSFGGIFISSSFETQISKMGGFIKAIRRSFIFYVFAILINSYYSFNLMIEVDYGFIFVIWMLLNIVIFINLSIEIFMGKTHADERVFALLKNQPILLSIFAVVLYISLMLYEMSIVQLSFVNYVLATILSVIVLAISYYILNKDIIRNYFEKLRNKEFTDDFATTLLKRFIIEPIFYIGRIIWLIIGFRFFEKFCINMIEKSGDKLLGSIGKVNEIPIRKSFVVIISSLSLLVLWFYIVVLRG